jgi:hypothetical protein
MNIEKMRSEFEAAVVKVHIDTGVPESDAAVFLEVGSNGYRSVFTKAAWWAWQQSRSSLEIELPAKNPLGSGPGDCEGGLPSFEQQIAAECNAIIDECREAIQSTGVKVK